MILTSIALNLSMDFLHSYYDKLVFAAQLNIERSIIHMFQFEYTSYLRVTHLRNTTLGVSLRLTLARRAHMHL